MKVISKNFINNLDPIFAINLMDYKTGKELVTKFGGDNATEFPKKGQVLNHIRGRLVNLYINKKIDADVIRENCKFLKVGISSGILSTCFKFENRLDLTNYDCLIEEGLLEVKSRKADKIYFTYESVRNLSFEDALRIFDRNGIKYDRKGILPVDVVCDIGRARAKIKEIAPIRRKDITKGLKARREKITTPQFNIRLRRSLVKSLYKSNVNPQAICIALKITRNTYYADITFMRKREEIV